MIDEIEFEYLIRGYLNIEDHINEMDDKLHIISDDLLNVIKSNLATMTANRCQYIDLSTLCVDVDDDTVKVSTDLYSDLGSGCLTISFIQLSSNNGIDITVSNKDTRINDILSPTIESLLLEWCFDINGLDINSGVKSNNLVSIEGFISDLVTLVGEIQILNETKKILLATIGQVMMEILCRKYGSLGTIGHITSFMGHLKPFRFTTTTILMGKMTIFDFDGGNNLFTKNIRYDQIMYLYNIENDFDEDTSLRYKLSQFISHV